MQSRIIITRPQPDCGVWASAIQAQGLSTVALPLIDIALVPFAWDLAARFDALVFVSRSAVEGFFQSQTLAALQAPRCLVTGPGTRAALIQCGVAEGLIDAPASDAVQFDSEALWQVIGNRGWAGQRVCVLRGCNYVGEPEGRSWLADKLTDAGASIDFVTTYQRRLPVLSSASREVLQNPRDSDVWVFGSSQAIAHLALMMPSADWSNSRAICTHDRIFITCKSAGFGKAAITRPLLADVLAALQSPEKLSWF